MPARQLDDRGHLSCSRGTGPGTDLASGTGTGNRRGRQPTRTASVVKHILGDPAGRDVPPLVASGACFPLFDRYEDSMHAEISTDVYDIM